jgi:hypothetical protein
VTDDEIAAEIRAAIAARDPGRARHLLDQRRAGLEERVRAEVAVGLAEIEDELRFHADPCAWLRRRRSQGGAG